MPEALIKVTELGKTFYDKQRGEIKAVDEVSFECFPGEIFGLLGPNGAGKTTTLRILATVIQPSSGKAEVYGHDIIEEPQKVRSSIGFLSSTTGLYPRLTPREILEYFGKLYGMSTDKLGPRIEELSETFDFEEFIDVPCEKLSTGMKQKTSIARTVVHDPPVLIFDEPTAGLDVIAAGAMIDFIRGCKDRNRTVLFSTHIMSEAEKICDRLAVIHQGSIRSIDTLSNLQRITGKKYLEDIFKFFVSENKE